MTGGVGFSKQGHDSFKDNRRLRNRRASIKDNLYNANNNIDGEQDPSITHELEEWRNLKEKKEKKLRLLIIGIILPLITLIALLTAIL